MPDWLSTLIWETLNFLIIVAVLYKLLYKPLRRFIRERQERIDAQREAAAQARSEAEAMRRDYEGKLQALADEEKAALAKARARADEEAQAILSKAREQAKAARDAATRRIERQVQDGVAALQDQVTEAALAMVGQVAAGFADSSSSAGFADSSLSAGFADSSSSAGFADSSLSAGLGADAVHAAALAEVDRLLGEVPEDERHRAGRLLNEGGEAVHVAAAPALGEEQRGQLSDLLGRHLGVDGVTLEVEERPDLIAGLEVRLKNLLVKAHWRDRLERFVADAGVGRGDAEDAEDAEAGTGAE